MKLSRKKEIDNLFADSPDAKNSRRTSPRLDKAKPSQELIELSPVPVPELGLIDDLEEDLTYFATADDSIDSNEDDDLIVKAIQRVNAYKEGEEVVLGPLPRGGYEFIHACYYDGSQQSWITKKAERIILPKLPEGYKVNLTDIAALQAQYRKTDSEYRNNVACYPSIITGEFQFCGCDQVSCLSNAALSSHYCGFCGTRMMGWCLVEPSTWGVCRKCFLVQHPGHKINDSNNQAVVRSDKPNKWKVPLNTSVKPAVPLITELPKDVDDDVVVVDPAIPTLPTPPAAMVTRKKGKPSNTIDSDSDFVDEEIPASAIQSKRSRTVSKFNQISEEGIINFDSPNGIIEPPKLRKTLQRRRNCRSS